jgi:hypothetical protein
MKRIATLSVALLLVVVSTSGAQADEVTDWNQTMLRSALVAGSSPLAMSRVAALVQAAVFDAVNGIDARYTPMYVNPAAPAGASRRAAVVQAAYVMLSRLYGTGAATPSGAQQVTLDARRTVALTDIAGNESGASIASGIAWGQFVADQIWLVRSTDGSSTTAPFPDNPAIGQWRRTPNLPVSAALSAPGVGYLQFSAQTPWVMNSPLQFRPGPPPAVTSVQYAREFNETKAMGSFSSTARTPDQTIYSLFWNSGTATYIWNRVALSLIDRRGKDYDGRKDRDDRDDLQGFWDDGRRGRRNGLLENARLLGALDVAMADAAIGCWDAKYEHHFWRPITAIRDLADDGNPATTPDPTWVPMFATPGHPEYPSGHSCISGAAAVVLAREFGERTAFTAESDLMVGVTRSYRSFSAALDEVKNARIFSGIHFRTACDVGQALGAAVARLVLEEKFQRVP